MAFAYTDYTANGTATTFAITFPRINDNHVKVYQSTNSVFSLVSGTAYAIQNNNVVFNAAPADANTIRVKRETPNNARLVDFQNGSRLGESDLDTDSLQAFYLLQEEHDNLELYGIFNTMSVMGQCSRMTDGTVNITTQGTYVLFPTAVAATLDATTANGIELDTSANGFVLKNVSGIGRFFRVYGSVDATAGNNKTLGVLLNHVDGQGSIANSECRAFTGFGNQEAKLVTSWIIYMPNNTSVALMVANHSGTDTITVKRARLVVSAV
jgi:hypothetical protein